MCKNVQVKIHIELIKTKIYVRSCAETITLRDVCVFVCVPDAVRQDICLE